jgi:anthranilate phosphoribosyltransferase
MYRIMSTASVPLPPEAARTDTHPFAAYVRILGRGPGRSRALSREEARHAFAMVLAGEVEPEQIGAFLMLLRYRGEVVEEMAGLVEAARAHAGLPWHLERPVDLDWPSYADGRTRGLPWYLLAALLLAGTGRRVVMHGPLAGPGRELLRASLARLEIRPATSADEAAAALDRTGFAFLPLEALAPDLARLLALRGVLGLRSPVNTVGRLLDPAGAAASIDGVFHPPYIALHLDTAADLGRRRVVVLKGGGGEAEWTGARPLAVHALHPVLGRTEQDWPALADAGGQAGARDADALFDVWRGRREDAAGSATVIATAALALYACGIEEDPDEAVARARSLWRSRPIG